MTLPPEQLGNMLSSTLVPAPLNSTENSENQTLSNPLIVSRVDALASTIRTELEQGIEQAKKLLNLARVHTYWLIGKYIAESYLDEDYHAAYGTSLYSKLGELIGHKERVLQHMVQFYRAYPECPQNTPLTWTHYRYLINVSDHGERARLEQEMIAEGVSSVGVKKFIPQQNKQLKIIRRKKLAHGKLDYTRGIPYVYAIRYGTDANGNDFPPRLDLGFKNFIDSSQVDYIRFVNARTVISHKENNGYRLETIHNANDVFYTYSAKLDRVIDGDTLIALIETGFGMVSHQRLRLRGINAPELKCAAGQAAKSFLNDLLTKAPRLVVKTYKDPEMYGRYLTDLFMLDDCDDVNLIAEQGMFVNQELLDRGLAEVY